MIIKSRRLLTVGSNGITDYPLGFSLWILDESRQFALSWIKRRQADRAWDRARRPEEWASFVRRDALL